MDDIPPILLETPRLILRYQSAADVPALTDLWADPAATRYMGGPRDRAWLQEAFAETAQDPRAEQYDLWPVVEKATGRVIGHCGLLDKEVDGRPEIELVYVFAPAVWGQGYATEMAAAIVRWAREARGLSRLIALIEPENAASERVAARIGMRLEKEVIRPEGARRRVYVIEADGVTIRPYHPDDAISVGRLIADTYIKFNLSFLPPADRAPFLGPFQHAWSPQEAHRAAIAGALVAAMVLVAEEAGEVVGVLRGRRDKLQSLFVREDHHRQGVGRRLVERFEQECARQGAVEIKVQATLYAVPFYQAMGYNRTTGVRLMHSFAGAGLPYQPMKKVLRREGP